MNLKRTKRDLLLRREKRVSTMMGFEDPVNKGEMLDENKHEISQVPNDTKTEDRLAKRAELLSQLPSSTKVEKKLLKVEPLESSHRTSPPKLNDTSFRNESSSMSGVKVRLFIPSYFLAGLQKQIYLTREPP